MYADEETLDILVAEVTETQTLYSEVVTPDAPVSEVTEILD